MLVILIKKAVFSRWLLIGALLSMAIGGFSLTVVEVSPPKNRQYFEKRGEIVWELAMSHKAVAITFDDGPSPSFTQQIMDLFSHYGGYATFFVTGSQVEKFPEVLQEIARRRHEIGNHLFHHRPIPSLSEYHLIQELQRTHRLVQELTGDTIRIFRPINGFYDEKVVRVARSMNYQVILWSQDSQDWSKKTGSEIAANILDQIRPGQILLFHDQGGNRNNTVDALKIILPELASRGYHFLTVSQLINLSHRPPTTPVLKNEETPSDPKR